MIDLEFGLIEPGQTKTFYLYYGVAPTNGDAMTALLANVHAELRSLAEADPEHEDYAPDAPVFIFLGSRTARSWMSDARRRTPRPQLLGAGLALLVLAIVGWWFLWPVETTCQAGISDEICADVAAAARGSRWASHRTAVAVQTPPESWAEPDPTGRFPGFENAEWAALLDGTLRIACWQEDATITCQGPAGPVEQEG